MQSEDSLREKTVESDLKGLLKTMVAFANSVAPGDTAQIFIGEMNDGTVQGVSNADNIQKKVRSEYDKIYPAWVRKGSETLKATEELYQQMIDLRSSKIQDLMKWLGKIVTVSWSAGRHLGGPNWSMHPCVLAHVAASSCTFRHADDRREQSEPTQWLTVSWDNQNARPRIFVNPDMVNRTPW